METQFGLAHIWQQGDWVTKFVALFLLGMSVASWLVIIVKSLNLMRYKNSRSKPSAFGMKTNLKLPWANSATPATTLLNSWRKKA